jgi:hypothetical protein
MPVWAFCVCNVPPYDGVALPSDGNADTDCAFAAAANPANNPTLRTVDLSMLTMIGLQNYPDPNLISVRPN